MSKGCYRQQRHNFSAVDNAEVSDSAEVVAIITDGVTAGERGVIDTHALSCYPKLQMESIHKCAGRGSYQLVLVCPRYRDGGKGDRSLLARSGTEATATAVVTGEN